MPTTVDSPGSSAASAASPIESVGSPKAADGWHGHSQSPQPRLPQGVRMLQTPSPKGRRSPTRTRARPMSRSPSSLRSSARSITSSRGRPSSVASSSSFMSDRPAWTNRNPVWQHYIPEYDSFHQRLSGGSVGQADDFVKRPPSESFWETFRAATPKASPLLFPNSMSWNRRHYEPDYPNSLVRRPRSPPKLIAKPDFIDGVDMSSRPPVVKYRTRRKRTRRRMPQVLYMRPKAAVALEDM